MKPFNSFSETASAPFFWWLKASDLYQAAVSIIESYKFASATYFDTLPKLSGRVKLTPEQQKAWPRLRFPQVYLFMVGLAFENLIKGLLISRNPDLVKNGKLSKKISRGHGLSDLLNKAEIQLSEEENIFVNRLSDSVLWAGRYPTPTNEKKWKLSFLSDSGYILPGTFLAGDEEKVEKLWRRLSGIIDNDPSTPKYSTVGPNDTD